MKHPRRALAALATILSLSAVSEAQAFTETRSGSSHTQVSTLNITPGATYGPGWSRSETNPQLINVSASNYLLIDTAYPGECQISARFVGGTNSAVMIRFDPTWSAARTWSPWLRLDGLVSVSSPGPYVATWTPQIYLAQANRSASIRFRLVEADRSNDTACWMLANWP